MCSQSPPQDLPKTIPKSLKNDCFFNTKLSQRPPTNKNTQCVKSYKNIVFIALYAMVCIKKLDLCCIKNQENTKIHCNYNTTMKNTFFKLPTHKHNKNNKKQVSY